MPMIRPHDCFYYLISRATLVATSVLKMEFEAAGVPEVRPAYLGVLLTLWNEDRLGSLELGRRAGLEPSSMTSLVDRMERDELIRREADPGDRRAQRICLTPTGKRCQQKVLEVVDCTLAKGTRGVSSKEISRTKEILQHFLTNLHEEKRGSHE
ncbi:MAG: MarR family transcriptional regulator [Deltaproteobacteria bacterium]|nr:MarR family transcriptional regulator [Deltaproteobacteria bacterium]